jgi:hypothetical protein
VILRCPSETVGTDTVNALVTTGGLIVVTADAETTMDSNCATHTCVASNSDCNATTCQDSLATCCDTALVAAHSCTCQESPISPPVAVHLPPTASGATTVALPLPHVSAHANRDCTVTVTETYDCPAGFWDTTSYLTLGPIHFVIDGCAPMCACMPIEIDALPAGV